MIEMDFEWDDNKARTNLNKHRVDFADAKAIPSESREYHAKQWRFNK